MPGSARRVCLDTQLGVGTKKTRNFCVPASAQVVTDGGWVGVSFCPALVLPYGARGTTGKTGRGSLDRLTQRGPVVPLAAEEAMESG